MKLDGSRGIPGCRLQKGFYMKNTKKRIRNMLFTCLPMLLLLSCGAAGQGDSLTLLLAEESGQNRGQEDGGEQAVCESAEEALGKTAFVHICGEVELPGVYEVAQDARICDVLLLAGGFTPEAATDAVNMAQQVKDGMQVVIPSVQEAKRLAAEQEAEADGRVELNTATAAQLCTLPGIGESRAAAILAYREEHGGFSAAEELMQVSGIKQGMFEKLKELVYVAGEP